MDIPKIGFGTWELLGNNIIEKAIITAINSGYKHIDTAQIYNNEYQIGKILKKYNIETDKIFITSKVWVLNYRYHTYNSVKQSLKRLQVKKINLMLLHVSADTEDNIIAYKELIRARQEGLIEHIGVSNFSIDQIEEIFNTTQEYPYTNQITVSPTQRIEKLEKYCNEHNIKITGYSTIRCYYNPNIHLGNTSILSDQEKEIINKIARVHDCSPAIVLLKWSIKHGYDIIPKSKTPSRIKENLMVDKIDLSQQEMMTINQMNKFKYVDFINLMNTLNWHIFKNLTNKQYVKGLLFDKNFTE